jgi:primosomal protein N' (replication factor Y)
MHWVIRDVVNNSYDVFYQRDLLERQKFLYPPHSRLIEITIKHKENEVDAEASNKLAVLLRNKLGSRVIGPHLPVISRIRNLYLRVLLIKIERGASSSSVKKMIKECIATFYEDRGNTSVRIVVDVDPM